VLTPGQEFEGYTIDSVLGRGGYAVVYGAHSGDRVIALKLLDERHRQPANLARLQREFAFAHQLDHRHVVRMYGSGAGWLAMELIDGGTVTALATLADRLAALGQIADALDYTHRRGIVHCDVKPSNILVHKDFSRRGAVLIDFGVAHSLAEDVAGHSTHVEASLPYSAPELLHGRMPSAATDEYALACATVELITGKPPFTAPTAMALIDEHLNHPPPRIAHNVSWIPRAVDSILAKAMAKNPDSRYQSCGEFVALITRALRHVGAKPIG
jgi:serine/threonine protein kinase